MFFSKLYVMYVWRTQCQDLIIVVVMSIIGPTWYALLQTKTFKAVTIQEPTFSTDIAMDSTEPATISVLFSGSYNNKRWESKEC